MTDLGNFTIKSDDWESFWGSSDGTNTSSPFQQQYLIGYTTTHDNEIIIPAKSEHAALQILAERIGCAFNVRYAFSIGD